MALQVAKNAILLFLFLLPMAACFQTNLNHPNNALTHQIVKNGNTFHLKRQAIPTYGKFWPVDTRSKKTEVSLFGPSEGFFGIGGPEALVIFAVGYFLLGPEDLYKLTKEIGDVVGNFQELFKNTQKSITESLESSINLKEMERSFSRGDMDLDAMWGNTDDAPNRFDMNDFVDQQAKKFNEKLEEQPAQAVAAAERAELEVEEGPGLTDAELAARAEAEAEAAAAASERFTAQLDADAWNRKIMAQSPEEALAAGWPGAAAAADGEAAAAAAGVAATAAAAPSEEELMAQLQRVADQEQVRMDALQAREGAAARGAAFRAGMEEAAGAAAVVGGGAAAAAAGQGKGKGEGKAGSGKAAEGEAEEDMEAMLVARRLAALAELEAEAAAEARRVEEGFYEGLVAQKMGALAALETQRVAALREMDGRFEERKRFIEEMFAPLEADSEVALEGAKQEPSPSG